MKRAGAGIHPASPDEEGPELVRRRILRTACHFCRKQKKRCDGVRPTCANCVAQGHVECSWDTQDESETRTAALRRENKSLQDDVTQLRENLQMANGSHLMLNAVENDRRLHAHARNLLETLATVSDHRSTNILAMMRSGRAWDRVAEDLYGQEASGLADDAFGSPISAPPTFPWHANQLDPLLQSPAAPWVPRYFDRHAWARLAMANGQSQHELSGFDPSVDSTSGIWLDSSVKSLGNLPFSSSICANGLSSDVQDMQRRNIFVPTWAMRPLVHKGPPDPFEDALSSLKQQVESGVPIDVVCGDHPYLNSLDDEATFQRAPLLSQKVASLVKSIKPHESTTFTQYAIMWSYWAFLRWLLAPSAETFDAIPLVLRPVPQQLFCCHDRTYDFIFSPIMRTYMCSGATNDRWITAGCVTIVSSGPTGGRGAVCVNERSGELDFSEVGKAFAAEPGSWTVGPSIRLSLRDADRYWTIRERDDAHEWPPMLEGRPRQVLPPDSGVFLAGVKREPS